MSKLSLFKLIAVAGVSVISCIAVVALSADSETTSLEIKPVIVGTYDSRAIAMAYAMSDRYRIAEIMKEKRQQQAAAEAKGDQKTADELERWGISTQRKLHLRGFGTAPVHEYLEDVKNDLLKIAKTAKVDIIVSKWEFDYQAPNAKTVDLTEQLVKLFDPSPETLKSIEMLRTKEPAKESEILESYHYQY